MKEENQIIIRCLNKYGKVPETYKLLEKIDLLEEENQTLKDLLIEKDNQIEEIKQQKTDYTKVNILEIKYNKALELLVDYGMPCEFDNFNLLDTDYCEINCSNDDEQFKKCWDKFIEWRLKESDK